MSEDRRYVCTLSQGPVYRRVCVGMQCTLLFPEVQRRPDKTCFRVPSKQKMFDAFLYGRPNVFQKIPIPRQLVVLSDAPQDCGALVLLLSPGGSGGPFNMVSLIHSPFHFLTFFPPTLEAFAIFLLPPPAYPL